MYAVLVAHSTSCCQDLSKKVDELLLNDKSAAKTAETDNTTVMCEEKQPESTCSESNGPVENGIDPPNPSESPLSSADDLSPLSSDSGHESSSSTPEAMTPHEERSATPSNNNRDAAVQASQLGTVITTEGTEELISCTNEITYRIKIVSPASEPFELLVNGGELVQELHQVLLDRESTCHRTCFSLQLDGQSLDHFTEWKNIEGMKDGALLRVVEEPYTMREARIHLRHIRDLLRSLDSADCFTGQDGASLSFVNSITSGSLAEKRRMMDRSVDCTPPEYVLPGSKERPLIPLQPVNKDMTNILCLKSIGPSGWNPPPGNRKLRGDVMYLVVWTLENRRYHITCCTKGFYVNQSSGDEFNPKPANRNAIYHSLIDLLNHLSPGFKRNFAIVQKKRSQRHIFERLPTPYQVQSWTAPQLDHTMDTIRAEDGTQAHRIGLEDHIPGQNRDWNEELQTTHELPRKTLPERLIRERAIFKIHSDFVAAAIKGAMSVVDGNVMAINPADDPRTHMFIWNNIFFSLGFDVKDHYKELGGDAAAFVAPANDLQGVKAYSSLDTEKLYTLGMVIVDYRGYRVTAQSIIPGILEREQEQSVVYGSVDFGKTVVSSEKYQEMLEKPAQQLKILPHFVQSGKEGEADKDVKLYSSFETKGIVGNDSRYYVLDLLRTFPPDVHYLEGAKVNDVSSANGYPRKFSHNLACLRQELIDAFVEARYVTFVRLAAFHLQQSRMLRIEAETEQEKTKPKQKDQEVPQSVETDDAIKPAQVGGDRPDSQVPETFNGHTDSGDSESKRDSGLGLDATVEHDEHDGERIAKEIKEKLVSKCSERDQSPSADRDDLPETQEAKRIVELSMTPGRKSSETDKVDDKKEEKEEPSFHEATTSEIIRKTAQAVGSLSDTEFDIRFNPDCYCDTVKHSPSENLEKQRKLVRDAAQFLLVHQIPNFIRDCLDHTQTPIDGYNLTESMHARGINIRYLGKIVQCLGSVPQLDYFKSICMCELVCRSVKHLLRPYLQAVGQASLAAAVAHFLNCLVGSLPNPQPTIQPEELNMRRRSSKKKRSQSGSVLAQDSIEWTHTTPKSLWQQICSEIDTYYGYSIECDNSDTFGEQFGVQKIAILRRVCVTCGIQILLKDYVLDNRTKAAFSDEDIVNLFPVSKHITPRAVDASHFFHTGQTKIQQGHLRAGFDLVAEALNLLNNVYGAMHPEIAQCMRLLARLAYILGDPNEALSHQLKATQMSERCCGIDHPQTIMEYLNLAHFSFANLQITTALKLLYRSRHLLLLAQGENHPLMAQIDSNIGVILYAVQEYDFSLKFLNHALKLHILYTGRHSLKTALIYHLVARTHSCRGDFRTALQFEKETFSIYKNTFGEEHEKTKESSECLRHLTQQAVTFQKRMNEASRNSGSISQLLPLQIQQPSLHSILEVLNILNGIIFIQLGSKESSDQDLVAENEELTEKTTITEIDEKNETTPQTTVDEVSLSR